MLLTLPEHLSSPQFFFCEVRYAQPLIFYVMFFYHCLLFCSFSFGHCIVYPSYASDHPSGIFKLSSWPSVLFFRAGILCITIFESWRINNFCISFKISIQCSLQQYCSFRYMWVSAFYSQWKTRSSLH
jgi:hypothetical protein